MYEKNISLDISPEHPAYQWAKRQSDSVNALGHIGTHIDCYTKVPAHTDYRTPVQIIDCSKGMPTIEQVKALELKDKSLVLYTGNLEENGYGTPGYGALATYLDSEVLDAILAAKPKFIVIDSYGIGAHGDEHIAFDQRCEHHHCFVIENVCLTRDMLEHLCELAISFDASSATTGKRCDVVAISHKQ
ncbi:hypothetical protein C9I98_18670 [Photobacterium sanctipauli]|uniref:Cyclase n=1 Tax=Photobacterium sanctipauli TaxID=1342794 RepID=A0A2T3NPD3_9GAMM|nr:cyclase family protein [Photobacterium sanctipauli]PSW18108.1 hypothetical protein C9I98_18670 [Photobacterium sanctipauli]